MFEESISSSPCKSKKSIRKLRCTRRSKRKDVQAVTTRLIQDGKMSNLILQHLYDSDEDSPEQGASSNTTFVPDSAVTDFMPFRMERHLCFGDRSSSSKLVNPKNVATSETSGFLPCLTTLECGRNTEVPNVGNCRYQVDEMLISTPDKRLSLVNSILEDFALSPYTGRSEENAMFWEYSPEFVLKSKPRITYTSSRRNKKRVDCNKRLDFSSNEKYHSDSSSISVQENLSQLGDVSTTDVPDTTERLCENLLNLSAYYTQTNLALDKHTPGVSSVETTDWLPIFSNVVNLVQEITSLRYTGANSLRKCSSYSPCQDFNGFPEENSDQEAENRTTLLDSRCCTSNVTLLSPICSQKLNKGYNMIMDVEADVHCGNSTAGQRFKKDDQFDDWDEDYMEIFAFIKTPPHSSKKELRKPVDDVDRSSCNSCSGFKTASLKPVNILEQTQRKADDMFENMPEIVHKKVVGEDIGINGSEIFNRTYKSSETNKLYDQPSTSKAALKANREYERRRNFDRDLTAQQPINVKTIVTPSKHIKYSTKSKTNEQAVFNNFRSTKDNKLKISEKPQEINAKNLLNSTRESKIGWHKDSNANTSVPFFSSKIHLGKPDSNLGFQTASGKNIKPSSKALQSVENLLKEFQSDLEQFDENGLELMKNKINLKQCKHSTSDTNAIDVKEKNKLWAEEVDLANVVFSEWPLEEKLRAHNSQIKMAASIETKTLEVGVASKQTLMNTEFEGFRTAGGKNVSISEKGRKIAENLLQKIEIDCDTNDLLEIKNSIHKKNNKNVVAHKPIMVHNDSALSFKQISSCEETVDSCNKAQHTHLNVSKSCKSKFINSFTELSAKSPLNVSVANSIIARKNLLSLSRKRKGCGVLSAGGTNDHTLAGTIKELPSDNDDTPNKMQSSMKNIAHVLETPSAPNGSKLFNNSPRCSTPRSDLNGIPPREIDDDFKPIAWNDNKSISGICSNTKYNSPNPSVNDRIARLRMYGEAPPISHIHANLQSNCRSSGLRPTRSMLKKAENK